MAARNLACRRNTGLDKAQTEAEVIDGFVLRPTVIVVRAGGCGGGVEWECSLSSGARVLDSYKFQCDAAARQHNDRSIGPARATGRRCNWSSLCETVGNPLAYPAPHRCRW